MGEIPQKKNSLLAAFDSFINGILNGLGADLIYAAVVAEVPFLGAPIVGWFVKAIIGKITDRIYKIFTPGVDYALIKFQTQKERDDYVQAKAEYAEAKKGGDLLLIQAARKRRNAMFDSLVHSDGV